MNFSFFKKTLQDYKWTTVWYSVMIILYGVMMVAFFPSIRDQQEELKKLIEVYPPSLAEAFGMSAETFGTIEGFLSVEYFSFIWVIIIAILIFSLGASQVAGEIDKKTSEFAFTLPIRRKKIVLEKFAASFLIILFVIFVTIVSTIIGIYAIKETPNLKGFLAFGVVASVLSFFLLSFTTLLSAMFSNKGRVYAVCGGFFTLSYLVHVLAGINEKVKDFYFLSFLKYYGSPEDILANASIDIKDVLVLLGMGMIFLIISLVVIEERDL